MTNYILGIFAKRSKLVDKKDIKDIASNTIQIISLVLLLITDIFLDGKLSGLSLLVVIILFIYSLFIQFKKLSTIPNVAIVDFKRPENLTTLEEGNLTSISIGGLDTGNIYSLKNKEAKIEYHTLQVKNIGIVFNGMEFKYKTRNFIVEYQPTFTDGLTEESLKDASLSTGVEVRITQIEFDNNAHPVTINMCNQIYQTELPYMLVHIEYSKSGDKSQN